MKFPDPLYEFLAREMIESHAENEWAAYLLYRDFHRRTRSADAGHLAREERGHYERLAAIYPWGSLAKAVKRRLARRPPPAIRSTLELHVANCIFDLAGLVQLAALTRSRWAEYARACRSILREEEEHKADGRRRLRAHLRAHPRQTARAAALARKWERFSLPAFGNAGSPLDRLAVRHALKSKTSERQRALFRRAVARLFPDL